MQQLTPMMAQYQDLKSRYTQEILFYRLGDFYEMFEADAVEAAKLLNITLTQRNGIPMCGVPHHAAQSYIGRLLRAGKSVAICEQDGSSINEKGIVNREVVEVLTPGTITDEELLEGGVNNYLLAISSLSLNDSKNSFSKEIVIASLDISTAIFRVTVIDYSFNPGLLSDELVKLSAREVLLQEKLFNNSPEIYSTIQNALPDSVIIKYPDWHFNEHVAYKLLCEIFHVENLKGFGLDRKSKELSAAGAVITYAQQTSRKSLNHLSEIVRYGRESFVNLDEAAQRNLELVVNQEDGSQNHTLLDVIDFTKTRMGKRALRRAVLEPFIDIKAIENRLNAVEELFSDQEALNSVSEVLSKMSDIERLIGRTSLLRAHPKDIYSIGKSFRLAEELLNSIGKYKLGGIGDKLAGNINEAIEVSQLVATTLCDTPPVNVSEGNIIKDGYSDKIDRLRLTANNIKCLLDEYLAEEKKSSGITNLKLRHNRVLGWYFETTKLQSAQVPPHFIKRQTLVGGERFLTEKLIKIHEDSVEAKEKLNSIERDIFVKLRLKVASLSPKLLAIARIIAEIDIIQSLSMASTVRKYVRPSVSSENIGVCIMDGRHPVVESVLPAGAFVPNSIELGASKGSFCLLTGPNMAGKSTYLRQTALIVLLAQIGSFVPAGTATLGIVDGIFCRVGASDNLVRGESTFLVEMNETARILRTATAKSLVILDEIGRGTSSQEGIAIAWAVSEYLLIVVGSLTLFATHFRELTNMQHENLKNQTLDVIDSNGELIFLRKVVSGVSDKSYGIHVASLAGMPQDIISRATNLLENIEIDEVSINPSTSCENNDKLRDEFSGVLEGLKSLDLNTTTPISALKILVDLQEKIRNLLKKDE